MRSTASAACRYRHPSLAAPYGAAEFVLVETKYDAVGNVIEAKDARGNTLTRAYDGASRAITQVEAAGTPDAQTTTFTYNGVGKPLTVTDSRATATYAYDDRHRRISETNGEGETRTFAYDQADQVISTVEPKGGIHETSFAFDEAGRVTRDQRSPRRGGGLDAPPVRRAGQPHQPAGCERQPRDLPVRHAQSAHGRLPAHGGGHPRAGCNAHDGARRRRGDRPGESLRVRRRQQPEPDRGSRGTAGDVHVRPLEPAGAEGLREPSRRRQRPGVPAAAAPGVHARRQRQHRARRRDQGAGQRREPGGRDHPVHLRPAEPRGVDNQRRRQDPALRLRPAGPAHPRDRCRWHRHRLRVRRAQPARDDRERVRRGACHHALDVLARWPAEDDHDAERPRCRDDLRPRRA